MADNDLKDTNGTPAAEIPDLKKKEKERKKAGAAWGSSGPGGSPFGGATGGAGAAARSAASAAASSAAGAGASAGAAGALGGGGLFGGLSAWLSGVLATTLGKALFALGALLIVGGGALVAAALLGGGQNGGMIPNLGALASSMKIDRGGADRTNISGKGDIRFDPLTAAKKEEAKKEEAPVEEKTAEKPADGMAPGTINDTLAGKDKLAHNLSGAKLTSNLGGGFGNKNIFGGAGSENAPKFNANLAGSKLNVPKAQNGKLSGMKRSARTGSGNRSAINRAKTQRAFGQLKVARGMSVAGAGASSADAARNSAANAFDQAATTGGELDTPGYPGGSGPTSTPSGGGGAPDVTSVPDVPDVTGTNGDPRMDQAFKGIQKMAEQAGKMKMMGMMLIALGVILEAVAIALLPNPFTSAIGIAILAIALMLVAIGAMMMQMASQMAAMAKQMGQTLAQSYGTGTYQEDAVNECTDQVLENGGGSCNREPYRPPETTVQQDVEAERNTPVTMEGGGPVP